MSSIKKNLAYQAAYEILVLILPFFTSPYISRVFGAEYLGIYSYTYSIAYYFQIFGMLGIKFHGNRAIAKVRDNKELLDKVFSEILFIHILVCALSTAVYVLYCLITSEYKVYSLIQGLMVLSAIFDVSWLFFGLERFKETVLRNSIIKIVSVVAIFIFVRSVDDLWKYIAIMAGSQLVSQVILFIMSGKYVKIKPIAIKPALYHIKPLITLFVPVLALSLFKFMDKIMLGTFGSKVELGYYENAEKLLNIPLSVIFSFGSVMLPRMSNLIANKDSSSLDRFMGISIKYMNGLAFAMAFGLAGIATVFAPVFWGSDFVSSGIIIRILAISIPFSTIASIIRNQDLIPNGKDSLYSFSIIAGAVTNLVLNWFLIPRYQAIGVSIATVISEVVVCIAELWFVREHKIYFKYIRNSFIYFIPSIVMFAVVGYIEKMRGVHIATLFTQIISGIIVFALLAIIAMIATKDNLFYSYISRMKKRRI